MGGFLFAHAGDVQQLVKAERLFPGHLTQGGIVEDHVGGHLLLCRQPLAQGVQRAQQRFVRFAQGHIVCIAAAAASQTSGAGSGPLSGLRRLLLHLFCRLFGQQAVGAIAALLRCGLAEVAQQKAPQAARCGGIKRHILEPLFSLAGGFGLDIGGQAVVGLHFLFDEEPDGPHIGAGVEQGAPGRFAVAAGPPGLLIVALQILGHVVVDDEPDIGLVDAHAERIGRHHDLDAVVQKVVLILPPGIGVELGVVRRCPDAPALQQAGGLVHLPGGAAINDARMVPLPEHQFQQNAGFLAGQGAAGLEVEVRAVEAGRDLVGVFQFEAAPDIVPDVGRGRRCERPDDRAPGQAVHERLDAEVAGAEVLPPLADAVGLVHRHHADLPLLREPLETRHLQPLRGHVDDLIPALPRTAEHQGFLVVGQAVVQERRRHTGLHQRPHLILHQADQRRDHDGDARQQQRGHLVADGLARTGGHHGQNVLPGQQPGDDLLLTGAEAIIAEHFF